MFLYIDPGTGSMLFTILLGVIGVAIYALKDLLVKLRFLVSGGKSIASSDSNSEYVIFSDHKRYWNVFEPICDEFEKRNIPITYLTSSEDDPALDKDYSFVKCVFIGEGNKAFARLNMLEADIVLSTTPSLDVLYWKRSKKVKYYVHIAHAPSDITMYRMFGIDFYDAILVSGDYQIDQIRELERLRGIPEKEVVKVGLTYMDTMRQRLLEHKPDDDHETTVLLAPSWGKSAIFSKFGTRILKALVDTGYHIIVRPHPQSFTSEKDLIDSIMKEFPESSQIEWNSDNDNFDCLNRSDILISDFSGVIFDFCLVFDKPVIYTPPDYDSAPYDACWLKETPWTFDVLPKIGEMLDINAISDLKTLIDRCLTDPRFKKGRDEARAETWAYIGDGTKRTVDYLTEKHAELMEAANDEK